MEPSLFGASSSAMMLLKSWWPLAVAEVGKLRIVLWRRTFAAAA
jgi:hypothetical protein